MAQVGILPTWLARQSSTLPLTRTKHKHAFDGVESFFDDGSIEKRLAASLGGFPASGIGVDVRNQGLARIW